MVGDLAVTDAAGFWDTYGSDIQTLVVLAGGILAYALIANMFYQVISKRVMFGATTHDGRVVVGGPGRGFLYLLLFPVISICFFLLLSASLLFLGNDNQSTTFVFTLAMAIILAVRVAAYFSEPASHDLAKMLPLGLLGVFLVNAETQEFVASVKRIADLRQEPDVLLLYFGIIVVAEFFLRTLYMMIQAGRHKRDPKAEKAERPSGVLPPREHGGMEGPGRK